MCLAVAYKLGEEVDLVHGAASGCHLPHLQAHPQCGYLVKHPFSGLFVPMVRVILLRVRHVEPRVKPRLPDAEPKQLRSNNVAQLLEVASFTIRVCNCQGEQVDASTSLLGRSDGLNGIVVVDA